MDFDGKRKMLYEKIYSLDVVQRKCDIGKEGHNVTFI